MKKFCADLKKGGTEVTNYEKKEILPLTDEEIQTCSNKKFCHISKKKFNDVDDSDDENVDVRKFHGDTLGLDDVGDGDYYDHDDDSDNKRFDVRVLS